jgi:PAS domain S-box-containing protein
MRSDRATLGAEYRETFNSIGIAMLVHDEAGQLLDFNDAACTMFGCGREQFREHYLDKNRLNAAPCSRNEFACKMRKVATEGPQTFRGQASRFDGDPFWCEVLLGPCTISGQKRVIASWTDITERKRVEEALAKERTFTNAVLDSVPGLLYVFDSDGRLVKWNKKAEEITGYSHEELAHRLATDWFREEDRERVAARIDTVFKEGVGELEATLITKSGTAVPFYFTGVRMFLDGKAYFTGIGIEVTQRYRDEESLRKLSQAVEQSPVNVVITDFEGNIEYVNPKFSQLTGYSLAEARGKNPRILKSGHTSDQEYQRLWSTIIAGGEWSGELLNKGKNGNLFWEKARITSIKDKNGKITHFLAVKEDITDQKQSQEAIRQMQLQLAHVARLSTLGEMAAEMAHELNQPLYAILNYARAVRNVLAEEGPVQVEQLREWTEEIADVAISAAEVVKRLRSFGRRGESPRTLCQIEEIIQEALSLVAADIQKAKVRMESTFSAATPPICVDRVQIQQVLVNLLKNAVEAVEASSRDGRRIRINTSFFGSTINVVVSDNGMGLPVEVEKKIFNPFVTTKSDGLGMGLSIARTIVESHGGRIWAKPNSDQGATFVFSLPIEERRHSDAP